MEEIRRGENLDSRLHGLEAMRDFLKSEAVEHDPHGILRELALGWYDAVTEDAASAVHKLPGVARLEALLVLLRPGVVVWSEGWELPVAVGKGPAGHAPADRYRGRLHDRGENPGRIFPPER